MHQSLYEITPYMASPLLRFSSREYVQKNQRITDEKLGKKTYENGEKKRQNYGAGQFVNDFQSP